MKEHLRTSISVMKKLTELSCIMHELMRIHDFVIRFHHIIIWISICKNPCEKLR